MWYSLISLISKYLCGWFSNPWILITIYGMGGVVIKGMGVVAWDCSIPEVRNKNFPLISLTIYLAVKAKPGIQVSSDAAWNFRGFPLSLITMYLVLSESLVFYKKTCTPSFDLWKSQIRVHGLSLFHIVNLSLSLSVVMWWLITVPQLSISVCLRVE